MSQAPNPGYGNNLTGMGDGGSQTQDAIRALLQSYKTELILTAHHHYYCRYDRYTNAGVVNAEWPVHIALGYSCDPSNAHSYGPGPYSLAVAGPDNSAPNIVKLTLADTTFSVEYIPNPDSSYTVGSTFTDSATYDCIGPLGTGTAPGAPTNLVATSVPGAVDLTWGAPTTGGTPTGYEVFAGSSSGGESTTPIATVTGLSYSNTERVGHRVLHGEGDQLSGDLSREQ